MVRVEPEPAWVSGCRVDGGNSAPLVLYSKIRVLKCEIMLPLHVVSRIIDNASGGNRMIDYLGHTGVWVYDLEKMEDFYSRVLGLEVTDRDDELGIVFFSSRPEVEHHEFVIQKGRTGDEDVKVLHQVSWRLKDLESLMELHRRFVEEGVRMQQVVTHGNALGIYFFDPEGNRNEVFWPTGIEVPQPFRKTINLDQSKEEILAEAERLLNDGGEVYQPVQ